MKALNAGLFKLTTALCLGICIGFLFSVSTTITIAVFVVSFIAFSLFLFFKPKRSLWFTVFIFLTFTSLGTYLTQLKLGKVEKNHYSNYINNQPQLTTFSVRDILKPNSFYKPYRIKIEAINRSVTNGDVILRIPKTDSVNLDIGGIYKGVLDFKVPAKPLNPGQFNYKVYLEKQGIHHQTQLTINQLNFIEHKPSISEWAYKFREKLSKKLGTYNFSDTQYGLINALFLGERNYLDNETYTNFIDAGVVHILAISGLHIGIILLILQFLFKPLNRLRYGKLIRLGLILICLWSFALISGFSASTVRAVTMFSLIAFSSSLRRKTSIYNTLIASAFILLLVNPLYLFDIGFQLSYLAVFAIVLIQPKLSLLNSPKHSVIKFLWNTFTVTVAAQIGVLPLSLFYFHQFPSLFFVSNIVIIPLLGLLLVFGFTVIILAFINILPDFLISAFATVLDVLLNFIEAVASFDQFIFRTIYFEWPHLVCGYLIVGTLVYWLYQPKLKRIKPFLDSIILLQLVLIGYAINSSTFRLTIFHNYDSVFTGIQNKNSLTILTQPNTLSTKQHRIISDYSTFYNTKLKAIKPLNNYIKTKGDSFIYIDSTGVYSNTVKASHVVLHNSPKTNLERLIQDLKPELIIASSNNYNSLIERWKTTCLKTKTPFYVIKQNGAYIIE